MPEIVFRKEVAAQLEIIKDADILIGIPVIIMHVPLVMWSERYRQV